MPEKRPSREAEEHFLKTPEKLLQTAEGEHLPQLYRELLRRQMEAKLCKFRAVAVP